MPLFCEPRDTTDVSHHRHSRACREMSHLCASMLRETDTMSMTAPKHHAQSQRVIEASHGESGRQVPDESSEMTMRRTHGVCDTNGLNLLAHSLLPGCNIFSLSEHWRHAMAGVGIVRDPPEQGVVRTAPQTAGPCSSPLSRRTNALKNGAHGTHTAYCRAPRLVIHVRAVGCLESDNLQTRDGRHV